MSAFEGSKWIWLAQGEGCDQYVEFRDTLVWEGGDVTLHLSCDTDYTLTVNGSYVASGQYGDFAHYKIYDTLDITAYLHRGENRIDVLVYHCGVGTSRYRPEKAGLIYEAVSSCGDLLAQSSERTLSRLSPTYVSGRCIPVSAQLGFTFAYDATGECDTGYAPSVCVEKDCSFFPRPIPKGVLRERAAVRSVLRHGDTHVLIDLGEETVGLPTLDLTSPCEQRITVAWGEHIEDGCVRRQIGKRNFYFEYTARAGQNHFTNYMLRLGGRYLEIFSEKPIEIGYVGVIPQVTEVEELPNHPENALDRSIYDACVHTLRLCMMEHYVDTPWREQSLYAFDSRNQMLFGYYVFRGGNAAYARANLQLIAEDRRADGLLSICYPCGIGLAIPSFSLHYIVAMAEYIRHTDDLSLASQYLAKMTAILGEFVARMQGGLVHTFAGSMMWNFYDWSAFAQGTCGHDEPTHPDLMLNCLFVIALDCFAEICARLDVADPYVGLADTLRGAIKAAFYTACGMFTMNIGQEQYTMLGNALAILAKIPSHEEAADLCAHLVSGELIDCSLSTRVFVYQALLDTDAARYRDWILFEIRSCYSKMLECGNNTVWETQTGASDFHNAGSLCHGWSAVPIYVYHRLGML